MGEVFIRTCKDCRAKFESEKANAMLCPKCREEHRKKSRKKHNAKYKKFEADNVSTVAAVGNNNEQIKKILRLCELYNNSRGVAYSYGKFVSEIYLGRIKAGEI